MFPLPIFPHFHIDFVVPPPGCGRGVTEFCVWGAHTAQLRYPEDVSDDMYGRALPGGAGSRMYKCSKWYLFDF
jgi:hypothetical protein